MKHGLAGVLALLVGAWSTPQAAGGINDALDAAIDAFWAAQTEVELASAVDGILATGATVDEIRSSLVAGRIYADDVPTGEQLLTRHNRDGLEHAYVLHVPESYDPATAYPVRVYLHGGVARPPRPNGEWWPNHTQLARDDSIVVFPVSWPESLWWAPSQIENLGGLLNDLKRLYNVDENRVHLLGLSDGGTGAYYQAFWLDPPTCAVGEPGFRKKKYRGEHSFPLILQNVHRYFLYVAILVIGFLSYDALISYSFTGPDDEGQMATSFGIAVGSLVLTINPILLGAYTFGCHSLRHLVGGGLDRIAGKPVRKKTYDCVSCLNRRHMMWAWCSLFWVGFTDFYVRMVSMGYITDYRLI